MSAFAESRSLPGLHVRLLVVLEKQQTNGRSYEDATTSWARQMQRRVGQDCMIPKGRLVFDWLSGKPSELGQSYL
jgi:hypothetical protein